MSNSAKTPPPRYQKIRELGRNREGGRVTYLAKDNKTEKQVVIKQFQFATTGSNWSGYKAYEREIQLLGSLNHPGIPRYLKSFETPKGFCMVQDYKEAESLAVSRQWKPEEIKQIALSILDILIYLQERIPPVIHRDIKPENILVDEEMNVYLVDFGFARIGGNEVAMSSVAAGTFGLMAPEQIFNRELSAATDLYGLGATLICLLTGTGSSAIDTLMDDTGSIKFKHRVSQLNKSFVEWLEKMVQPELKDRYTSASVAKEALISVNVEEVAQETEKEKIIAQRYRILGTLGEGGSGTTYQAQDLQTSQEVALKALSLQRMNDWKVMELFEREARVLAQLNHPNIPKYLEYFHVDTPEDRSFYIAQQLAPGASLATLVQNGWRANEAEVRRIAIQILEILVYLHELKPSVIHRDIKPQNIIRNSDGQIFLVDFGAVQDTYHSTFMRGSTVVGTYGYMAPEQFRGQAVPTTDLYGLGATLLFLLTHRSPADLPTDRLKIDFRSRIQVSEDFADWLEKILEPDVEDRFLSAKEALLVLRGKRMVKGKSKSSLSWKAIVGVGVGVVVFVGVVTSYKYAIFNYFGLTGFVHASILERRINLGDYLSKGGNIKDKDSNGLNLLHQAVQQNKIDINIVELLIAKGADINAKENYGYTPLYKALKNNNYSYEDVEEVAELLIAKGADLNVKNTNGNSPLHFALQNENLSDPQDRRDEIYKRDEIASEIYKRDKIAKLLIAKGADVNAKDANGYTPLQLAVKYKHNEIAKLLIAKGADINAKDANGDTLLHKELYYKYYKDDEIAKLLIAKGADINAQNNDGYTPLRLALQNNNKEIAELLKSHGAKK